MELKKKKYKKNHRKKQIYIFLIIPSIMDHFDRIQLEYEVDDRKCCCDEKCSYGPVAGCAFCISFIVLLVLGLYYEWFG